MSKGRALGFLAVVGCAAVLAGCGSDGDSDSAAASCDKAAITEGLATADTDGGGTPKLDADSFGCSGDWAYAYAEVGEGDEAITETFVLHAEAGAWKVDNDRESACRGPGDEVPEDIFRAACKSN